MKRLMYFKTNKNNEYYHATINGNFRGEELWEILLTVDSELVRNTVEHDWNDSKQPALLHIGNYTVYAVPNGEISDGVCITALITDFDTHLTAEDFKTEIEKDVFLKRQFAL